ncbi:ABC transporter substrate-binding protein [Leifsonia shinshuensis]|uniref:ABC transporter substrate-binding protein n=1 Tax=Leifsonia shinshuensis TaxID=150026 RepID=UPI00285F7A19|nr:ABC transporter substrate-binding protein [Leifsonia shinshuensis]MDR6972833.1 multiple sugar transport system substrate-binding protein [Leifsonia shinshuensis]
MAAAALVALSGCTPSGGGNSSEFGFTPAKQVKDSPITVWVDASREPAIKAFEAKYPDIKLNVQTYDGNASGSNSFQTKISLFDQAGSGWPDVVFSTQNNDASWASKENNGVQAFAAPLNKGWFDKDFLDGFAPGALDPLTVNGTVYGLRNDLAQSVFWYNKALFDQFGYKIPTTWEEYEQLSDKLAAEHPGYILGSVGDAFVGMDVYYWGAQAPVFQVKGNTFNSDVSAKNSTKMTEMLDHMIANGTLTKDSVFSSDFVQKYKGKALGMPGPVWFTGALFQNPDSLNVPAGQIGAGTPLHWQGEKIGTGNVGGGTWFASSHTKNLKAVKTLMEFVTSSDDYQVKLAGGYPAYAAAAKKWIAKQATGGYFVGDFQNTVVQAAGQVWSGWGYPSFSAETGYSKVVLPAIAAGHTIKSVAPQWEQEMKNEAQVQGYTVSK